MINEALECTVERITYYNQDTGYTVIRASSPQQSDGGLITVVGVLVDIAPGECLRLHGAWFDHPRFGRQFRVETFEQIRPATLEGVCRYLGSGLIKGVGPVIAKRIVDEFGVSTLEVLDKSPEKLRSVPGIGPKKAEVIQKAWNEQKAIQQVMLFLQSHAIRTSLALKIYRTYGNDAIRILEKNPYQTARDIWGIGFLTADRIAQSMGINKDDRSRVDAGILYILNQAMNEGHVFLPRLELAEKTSALLMIESALNEDGIDRLILEGECLPGGIQTGPSGGEAGIYLAPLYYAETGFSQRITRMQENPHSRLGDLTSRNRKFHEDIDRAPLTELQRQAVRNVMNSKVSILTGGPGTGKTTTLRTLVEGVRQAGLRVALASPTGRAAKRLSEATGYPASTIHRLLGYKPQGGFSHDEESPLDVDLLVVDEASMLDILLANQLSKALDPSTHLLLVGDADQLPSVGPGDVLRDLMNSGVIPTVCLDTIFRQDEQSLIVFNAHRINKGEMPLTPKDAKDFFLFVEDNPGKTAALLVDVVKNRIPGRFGLDPLKEIQVLAPMYRGKAGIDNLNAILQENLNPSRGGLGEKRVGGVLFRVGDKVMQTRNNYQKDVFNGDIGWLEGIDSVKQDLSVRFGESHLVHYDFSELDELVLAYCISVHKSQGSEYPCIVMPILTSHYVMLQRNLLYTAITRARRLVVLVGSRKAIAIAVANNKTAARYTGLKWRLEKSMAAL